MPERKDDSQELRMRVERIERMLEQLVGSQALMQKQSMTDKTPWNELINRPRPPHPDPHHRPPDVLLALGQELIFSELSKISAQLEEIKKKLEIN